MIVEWSNTRNVTTLTTNTMSLVAGRNPGRRVRSNRRTTNEPKMTKRRTMTTTRMVGTCRNTISGARIPRKLPASRRLPTSPTVPAPNTAGLRRNRDHVRVLDRVPRAARRHLLARPRHHLVAHRQAHEAHIHTRSQNRDLAPPLRDATAPQLRQIHEEHIRDHAQKRRVPIPRLVGENPRRIPRHHRVTVVDLEADRQSTRKRGIECVSEVTTRKALR